MKAVELKLQALTSEKEEWWEPVVLTQTTTSFERRSKPTGTTQAVALLRDCSVSRITPEARTFLWEKGLHPAQTSTH